MENKDKERAKKRAEYEEGLKKTLIPLSFGVLAGILSFFLVKDPVATDGLLIAIIMIFVQKFVYRSLHIAMEGAKDWIYIAFMTVFCWFVAYTLLLDMYI
jgi:heme/copper-type cytochrome/quinol oxidase subunit 4